MHAARGEQLTNAAARELLGVDSTHARGALQRLRDEGFLDQYGERSGARYMLADDISAPSGLRMTPTDMRLAVMRLAADGPVTNRLLRQRFALEREEALRILTELVHAGELVLVGERRASRYVRPTDAVAPVE